MRNLSEIYKKVTAGTGTVAELVSLVAQVRRLTRGGHILSHRPCPHGLCRILRSIFLASWPFFWYYCKYDKKAKETETKQMRDIPKFDSREIGQNLRSLMKQHDMTVKDLQKILGLSCPQTIYHWLNGDSVPTIDNLYNLSHHFDICINELLMGHCPKV